MEKIDSHQHFWNYQPVKQPWITNDMKMLMRNFGAADLLPRLAHAGIDGSVAVQASQAEEENDFLLQIAEERSWIRGIVGWIDLQQQNAADRMAFYQQFRKIKGFRHVIHDEPDLDFMLQPAFLKNIKALRDFNFSYDILIFPAHLHNTAILVEQFPDQFFVVDHMAKPNIKTGEFHSWRQKMERIANCPNVYCKISGMVTEANRAKWKKEDFTIYLDAVVDMFGTDRIMYGSDWPVCTCAGSYQQVYELVEGHFAPFSTAEKDMFFGGNAKRFYRI
jgi:L-fuconolactonase